MSTAGGCCVPGRPDRYVDPPSADESHSKQRYESVNSAAMVSVPADWYLLGSDDELSYPSDGEGPQRTVYVDEFKIDVHAVTNRQFRQFVDDTGYLTEAEQLGDSFVFAGLLPEDFIPTQSVMAAPWWRVVIGANWKHPEGPQSSINERLNHPVVHVSWNDARAYCEWRSVRLPTENEWEAASRGGLIGKVFPWGDELLLDGHHMMNVWQGVFPNTNTIDDGFASTAPVLSFPPNGYGLYEMTGNTWEWTSDRFNIPRWSSNDNDGPLWVQKGGSYLCHASYCRRYRCSARQGNTADTTAGNVGFRCARSAKTEGS